MKTYYIYHIPNVKIGCTTRPKSRVSQQGYSSYEILETHDCIDTASQREVDLQKEYGYPIDKGSQIYKKAVNIHKNSLGKPTTKKKKESNSKTMRKYNISRRKSVLQYTKEGKFVKEYISVRHAMKETGFTSICKCLKLDKYPHAGGFIWKYKD